MGVWQEEIWFWHLIWRRTLYEWENDELSTLKSLIEHKRPIRGVEDGVIWRHSGSLCYPVKSITAKMNEEATPTLPKTVTNIVWQKFIPPRAQLYVWLTNLGKLSTGDFLLEKGIIEPHRALCPFCNLHTESKSHVIFTCDFSWRSWMHMLEWWGLSGTLHNQGIFFTMQWMGLVNHKKQIKLWGLILGCLIWSLWFERNRIKFENASPNINNFVRLTKIRIGIWAKEIGGFSAWSAEDISFNLNSIL